MNETMPVTIRLFARARDLAGTTECVIEVPSSATVAMVRAQLLELYPALSPIVMRLLVAVNADYVSETAIVPPQAEVAFFPPVSGG
jgi:sulfur-carrier protein